MLKGEKKNKAREGDVETPDRQWAHRGEGSVSTLFFSLDFLSSATFSIAWFWIECQITYAKL